MVPDEALHFHLGCLVLQVHNPSLCWSRAVILIHHLAFLDWKNDCMHGHTFPFCMPTQCIACGAHLQSCLSGVTELQDISVAVVAAQLMMTD